MRRINSTRRIRKEIRTQRSSFLGLESTNDDSHLELSIAPPPDMVSLLREERRIEKQYYIKSGLCDNSDNADSRDSGVSENHSRQSSELFTSSEELDDYHSRIKEADIITETNANNEGGEVRPVDDEIRMKCIEDQIREQEEVLRVERELLELEQEELKRQRNNLLARESVARQELDHGQKMLMSVKRRSLQDVNESGLTYVNMPPSSYDVYQVQTEFRKSMPDLQNYSVCLLDLVLVGYNNNKFFSLSSASIKSVKTKSTFTTSKTNACRAILSIKSSTATNTITWTV